MKCFIMIIMMMMMIIIIIIIIIIVITFKIVDIWFRLNVIMYI